MSVIQTNKQTPNQTNIKIEIVTLYTVVVIYINTKISNSMDTQHKQHGYTTQTAWIHKENC